MRSDRASVVVGVVALLAVAGWVWALSDEGMPDAAWLVTVVITVVALVLAAYMLVGRSRGARAR